MADVSSQIFTNYALCFESLRVENVHQLREFVAPDVRFVDPFQETRGVEEFIQIFERMFKKLENPRFVVGVVAVEKNIGFLKWEFFVRHPIRRKSSEMRIVGVSEVHLNSAGKVDAHLDHWDAATYVYAEIPCLGPFVRWLQRRFR